MHELSVTKALTDMILRSAGEHGALKVNAVEIVLGEKSGYVPECIAQYFELLAADTIAEKAVLRFQSTAGNEFYINQMEIEEP